MKARLTYLVHSLHESFWFLPTLMAVAVVGLSVLTLAHDRDQPSTLLQVMPWAAGLGLENARLIMSTIAGAMITVTSLVFSLTLVSLTLASAQLGPRLLTLFMRDRLTQTVLGVFIATFLFALLVLASLGGRGEPPGVPSGSIGVALLLTFSCVGLLIAFIHHLATSLQADVVVARVADELDRQLALVFSERARGSIESEPVEEAWEGATPIPSGDRGYVQTIDCEALVEVARAHDIEIRLQCRAGQFVCLGEPLALVRTTRDDPDDLAGPIGRSIVFGPKRTQAEDPEFALQSIVEIALRALSPGVNDPYTAITCIDRLGEALVGILGKRMPSHVYRGPDGTVRLRALPLTLKGLFDTAFNEIRQTAAGNVAVLIRLGEALGRLAHAATTAEHCEIIRRHLEMLARSCEREIVERFDREDARARLGAVELALARRAGAPG